MQKQHKFSAKDKMVDLINEDYSLLLVISRFGVPLGFGDNTVQDVCKSNNIHCETFLAIVNFLSEGDFEVGNVYEDIAPESVIGYLKNAHSYFIDFKLPAIRAKLLQAVNTPDQIVPYTTILLKFYDEYVSEVGKHMEYENKVVFPYVLDLLVGKRNLKYSISVFEDRHNEIDSKLAELKNILIKYFPASGNNHLLTEVLFDILSCEKDLASHNQVEDYLFVPAIEAIEQKNSQAQ
jgi:regulator of cell morphogenesis and NO signaling